MVEIANYIGFFFAAVAILAAVLTLARAKSQEETIKIYQGLNQALREEREEIKKDIHQLECKVDLLQSDWGDKLADKISAKVVSKLNGTR